MLEWRESDGPAVQGASIAVQGASIESFGSSLLRRLIGGQLAGSLRRHLHNSGVTCTIELPAQELIGSTVSSEP